MTTMQLRPDGSWSITVPSDGTDVWVDEPFGVEDVDRVTGTVRVRLDTTVPLGVDRLDTAMTVPTITELSGTTRPFNYRAPRLR